MWTVTEDVFGTVFSGSAGHAFSPWFWALAHRSHHGCLSLSVLNNVALRAAFFESPLACTAWWGGVWCGVFSGPPGRPPWSVSCPSCGCNVTVKMLRAKAPQAPERGRNADAVARVGGTSWARGHAVDVHRVTWRCPPRHGATASETPLACGMYVPHVPSVLVLVSIATYQRCSCGRVVRECRRCCTPVPSTSTVTKLARS